MRLAAALALGLAVAAAAACEPAASEHAASDHAASDHAASDPGLPAGGAAASHAPHTQELLGAMAMLAGRVPDPEHLGGWAKKIDGGEATLGGYIDELLAGERFAAEVIPALVFGGFVNVRNYYALPSAYVLKRGPDPGAPLYLRAPCPTSAAVTVRPWWNFSAEVKVCPEAYRPEKWTLAAGEHSYKTQLVLACDSQVGSPELEAGTPCGCGPNLIRCMRDEEQYHAFNHSLMDEVKQTTAHVVRRDLPMAALFTSNATFRDRNAELYYRRQKIGALELRRVEKELGDLARWPEDGKWAPREEVRPGQHAGVLTAPQLLHWLPDRRQRQRAYYEVLWCNLRNSFGATTHKVLELNANGNNFFVHDSWERLAHTELCMNCHARLDYGAQFFRGYPDSRASTHYVPALEATGAGPLYGQDLRDRRGEGPLTPAGFAKLATEQPDFKSCMTGHFVDYVLGGRATADDLRAIEAAVERTPTFRASMKAALERFAERWREEARAPRAGHAAGSTAAAPAGSGSSAAGSAAGTAGSGTGAAPPGPGGGVAIGAPLRAQIDRHCIDCHDEAPYADGADTADLPFDLRGAELPRALVVGMAEQVAFGMMPQDQPLDPRARDELVGLLIEALWSDPAARAEAGRYYLGRARGLPAQQIDNALEAIGRLAQSPSDLSWGAMERGIWIDQATITPGFLATTGLEALRACARARESRGAPLEDCLFQAAPLNVLSRWPLPPPPPPPPAPTAPPP